MSAPVSTSSTVARSSGVADRLDRSFLADVEAGLSLRPKRLPSRYLYDPLGLALFDAICELPWYGLMRAERRLLQSRARDIFDHVRGVSTIVALGCGNGEKIRLLLQSRGAASDVTLELIDFSVMALERSTRTLSDLSGVSVVWRQATYESGLEACRADVRPRGRRLALFLGSNIGNCDPAEAQALLDRLRHTLAPGDALLLGADLIKPEPALRLAYDDPLGVTAAFNRNLLARLNRELGTDFDLQGFEHQVRWNADASRVEMHLAAVRPQTVRIPAAAARISFDRGETIWTESSYKYEPAQLAQMLAASGFETRAQWIDPQDAFALTLAEGV
jgi:dimethylhistidine N-methyltransferase